MKLIFIILTLSVISANAQLTIIDGEGCKVSGKCVQSLNYGSAPYGPNENCKVEVNVEFGVFEMNAFRTEYYWDVLSVLDVNGDDRLEWSGFSEIPNFSVEMGEKLTWASDYGTEWEGFNVCLAEPCTYGEANDVDCACTDAIIKQPPFALCTAANGLYCDAGTGTCGAGDACLNIDGSAANNVDCACGTAVSNSVNGRFCEKSYNVVSDFSIQECPYTDGYTLNEPKCTCGTALTDSVNVFCDKAHNRVSASVYCLYTDGSELNEATCTCGTALTDSVNVFCDKAHNRVSASVYCLYTDGSELNEATCTCGTTLCEKAATGLYCDAGTCGAGDECLNIDGLTENNVDCACGTAVSNSVNGRFCKKSYNVVSDSSIQECLNTDGSAPNEAATCTCGTALTDSVNVFCDKAHNRVSASVYCLHTDGSALNEATCMCGTTLCTADSGLICYEGGLGSCRKKSLGAFGFGYTIEDDCTQAGSYKITDRYMCETAANSLTTLMIDKDVIETPWSDEPSGCYAAATVLKYNPFDVSHVDFEDAACQSYYSSFCLCIVAAACTDGALANDDACMCDTTLCTAEFSGLYCNAGTCGAGDACLNIDGSAANNVDCACGTAFSNSVNGRFCEKSYNFVSDSSIQECLNTDGSAPNEATCTCGNTLCTADSGLICYEGGLGSCRKEGLGAFGFGLVGFDLNTLKEECESDPGSYTITDPEMCATAAKSLLNTPGRPYTPGVSLNVVISTHDDYRQPSGCYYDQGYYGDHLLYNDNPARHGGECNVDGDSSDFCLCIVAAACTDGALANDACMCDTALCTAATGLYCDAGTCGAGDACLNIDGLTENNVDCACGTAVSNSVNGRFCKKSYNVVSDSSIQECLNTDGSAPNEAATCTCGTALTDSVNVFCDKAHNRVSASVYCLHTDGSALNEATCTCGNTLCTADSGLICYEGGLGSCRKEGLGAFGFGYTIEDNCTQAGSYPITTLEMCATAANSRVSTLEVIGGVLIGSMGPTGCYRNVNTMRYNDNPESTEIACQSVYSSFCLCIVAAASCTDGALANDACMCDTALCTAATGLYCDAGTCGAGVLGCTDATAFNHDASANTDDGTCVEVVLGCTDTTMYPYNAAANTDDGTCVEVVLGCTDTTMYPYNAAANTDDGTCVEAVTGCRDATAFNYDASANVDDDSCIAVVLGCTDTTMYPYNAAANTDDGTCVEVVLGCRDATAFNYDASANVDDDSCIAVVLGCTDTTMYPYNAAANTDDGTCVEVVLGCTDTTMYPYNAAANTDDGTCVEAVTGCRDATAFNYDASANVDDDSCIAVVLGCTDTTMYPYNAAANTDDGTCVEVVLGCTDTTMYPYNAAANTDDGTCVEAVTGCRDATAFNYDASANVDDDSCIAVVLGCTDTTMYPYNAAANTDDGTCVCPEGTSVNGYGTVCTSCLEEEQNWLSGGCDCGGGKSPEWCTEQKRIWVDKGCNSQCSSNE